jgi:hypothetical protein
MIEIRYQKILVPFGRKGGKTMRNHSGGICPLSISEDRRNSLLRGVSGLKMEERG